MRCVYPLFQPLQTFTAATLFSCSPHALFTASIRILSNRFGEVLFTAVQEGIRGARRSPEGQWGRTERDTWFPWQPDRMEPLKLCDVMFEIWKKQLCFDWMHLKLFFNFRLLLSLQLCGIIHTAPFNTPTSAQQTGYRNMFPSLLPYIDVLCFQHMMAVVRTKKKKKLFVLLQVRFHNDWIHMQTLPLALHMLKLSPKFQAVSCVSTRGGVWCGSEGRERTAELVSLWLFIWVVVRLQESPRALI